MQDEIVTLRNGAELRGERNRYVVKGVLGKGSFGITYLADAWLRVTGTLGDDEVRTQVAVKEFFISEMNMERDDSGSVRKLTKGSSAWHYAERFRTEALNLAKLEHDNIVRVIDFIEAQGTYYYVMRLVEGDSLDDYLKQTGPLNEQEALGYIESVGSALIYMHERRLLHLDLKPKNIMRRTDGRVVLIDFGLSKQFGADGMPEKSTSIGLGTSGYAPVEQSTGKASNEFQPTLDVYALGATLYKLLTGKTPPEAADIVNDGLPLDYLKQNGVSSRVINAIVHAMEGKRKDRTPTVSDFLEELGIELNIITEKNENTEDDEEGTKIRTNNDNSEQGTAIYVERKNKKKLFLGIVCAGVLALAAIVLIPFFSDDSEEPNHIPEQEKIVETEVKSLSPVKMVSDEKSLSASPVENSNEKNVTTSTPAVKLDLPSEVKEEKSSSSDALLTEINHLKSTLPSVDNIDEDNEEIVYEYLLLIKQAKSKGLPVTAYAGHAAALDVFYSTKIDLLREYGDDYNSDIQRYEHRRAEIANLR